MKTTLFTLFALLVIAVRSWQYCRLRRRERECQLLRLAARRFEREE
jgi:hypothetical protein